MKHTIISVLIGAAAGMAAWFVLSNIAVWLTGSPSGWCVESRTDTATQFRTTNDGKLLSIHGVVFTDLPPCKEGE